MKEDYYEDVGGPVTALALNKTTNQVAVAGRSVFKIYNIFERGFEVTANLRVSKGVTSSCNDITWNKADDSILATATPSGAIVIWNLNKPGYSKMDTVYQDHKRTVNKIHFNHTDANLLISGSQDSIKVFDLRQSEAVINYSGLSESVRDLQFSPHKPDSFISVQDNGYIQLYDLRKKDRYVQCFPGHNGPIFACDWHPDQSEVVATAGRDMSIKVWSLQTQVPVALNCIPTMESVSIVRWSFDNKNHIASSSLKRDYNINIWDIHRPYIASARFTEPQEITTGMSWRRGVANLISVTSNGVLYQLPLSDAYRPLEHANPVGMAINPDGDIALALGNGLLRANVNQSNASETSNNSTSNASSVGQSTNPSAQSQSTLPARIPYQALPTTAARGGARQSITRRSQDSALRPKISSRSQLDVYKCTEMNWFVKTAQEYQLANRPLAELCDHNAEVCAKLRRFQICQTWKILKLFYANINTAAAAAQAAAAAASGSLNPAKDNQLNSGQQATGKSVVAGDDISVNSQLHGGSEFSYISRRQSKLHAQGLSESILDDASLTGSEQTNDSTDEWLSHDALSYEAFQPKHEICGRVDKLMSQKMDSSPSSSASSTHEDDVTVQSNPNQRSLKSLNTTVPGNNDLKIAYTWNTKAYQFKFYEIIADVIADVLKYHVDNSDVQSAVSILIVLGDRIKNIVNERIPEVDRESWYYSYIDLLSKFQLWNVMAQVINLSPLQNINSINQTSTTIYTTCGTCNRPLNGKVSWICDRCKTKPSECSVCHGVVSGLMAWCQGCYHGGHLIHMSKWFAENDYCPTGCGHMCEISQWR